MRKLINSFIIVIVFFIILVISFSKQYTVIYRANLVTIILLLFFLLICLMLISVIIWQGKKIEEAQSHFKNILNSIPMPIFITNSQKKIEFVNELSLNLLKKQKEELIGKSYSSCNLDVCNSLDYAIDKMVSTSKSNMYVNIGIKHYMVNTAYLDNKSKHNGFIEVIQDISEIVNMQNKLKKKNLELKAVSENLVGEILMTSLDKGFPIVGCNHGYCNLIGYTEDYLIGESVINHIATEDTSSVEHKIREQLRLSSVISLEQKLIKKDGSKIWVSLYGKQTFLNGEDIIIWTLIDISKNKEYEIKLKNSEERYRIATQNTEDIIVDYNIQTKQIIHTSKVTEIYGVKDIVENAPESIIEAGIISKHSIDEFLNLFDKIRNGSPKSSCIILTYASDGRSIWNRISFTTIFDNQYNPIRAIGILQDVTKEQDAIRQYEREVQYRNLIVKDVILYYEANLTKQEFVTGHEYIIETYSEKQTNNYDTIIKLMLKYMVYKSDYELVLENISLPNLIKSYKEGKRKILFEYRRNMIREKPSWVECSLYLLEDDETKEIKVICYIRDINEMKTREIALKYKSERDLLTGLYNKISTETFIKEYLEFNSNNDMKSAFLLLDLDNFKMVNDTLGHAFGDAVLSEVSQNLLTVFDDSNIIGRIGGDEFIIFIPNFDSHEYVLNKSKELCKLFNDTYTGYTNNYKISVSIGIAFSPEHGVTFQELYNKSDIALYNSKKNGKDTFSIYSYNLEQMEIHENKEFRGIDNNFGKAFSENIIEYVVRILYESSEPKLSINAIIGLVANHFNYNYVYLFELSEDRQYWTKNFEWYSDSMSSRQNSVHTVPYSIFSDYLEIFSENELFIVHDVKDLPKYLYNILETYDTHSMLQFAIKKNNVIEAFIVFDKCNSEQIFNKEELSILKTVSMLLGIFILNIDKE